MEENIAWSQNKPADNHGSDFETHKQMQTSAHTQRFPSLCLLPSSKRIYTSGYFLVRFMLFWNSFKGHPLQSPRTHTHTPNVASIDLKQKYNLNTYTVVLFK